jgi:hypothetical protein
MTRTCLPLVRYTLKIPTPVADRPILKYLACAENLEASGKSLIANGSSKDSSISRGVKELSSETAEVLSQSNSIQTHSYIERKYIVNTLYLHPVRVSVNVFLPWLDSIKGPPF